jgi:hypothetical protein
MAAAGIGLAAHIAEGFARRLIGCVTRNAARRLSGSVGATVTGAAMSFATTYALGKWRRPTTMAGARKTQQFGPPSMQQSRQLQSVGLGRLMKGII